MLKLDCLVILTLVPSMILAAVPKNRIFGDEAASLIDAGGKDLILDVLHINDIHSYFEETNKDSARCRDTQDCYGGIARIYSKQKEIRHKNPDTTIFLNAGDFYQGTLWYTKFKYEPMIKFGNHLNYTAMGLGNHDFDDGVKGLIPFADATEFDLLACNMVISESTALVEGQHFSKSVVKVINGTKVGIIGFITQTSSYNFPNSAITFRDEIASIKAEAERLDNEGVKILIGLGHSGYVIEQKIAEQVPLLDLVVGGHSHTFLYTPIDESDVPQDYVEGPYPTYVVSDSGKTIPVVQAKKYSKYLGHLTLHFDANGELKTPIKREGISFAKPYLMDNSVIPDPDTLRMMESYQADLTEYKATLGNTSELMFIPDDIFGDSFESNLGNALTESMAAVYNDSYIALLNNGAIRNKIELGSITGEDIFYVLPFGNKIDRIVFKGAQLKKAFEKAAANLNVNNPASDPGFGLQFTGLKLEITVTENNVGNRISNIHTKNQAGNYEKVDDETNYIIAIIDFMAPNGARQYDLFKDIKYEDHIPGTVTDYEAMRDWVVANSPLAPKLDGRLKINYVRSSSANSISAISLVAYAVLRVIV